MYNKNRWVVITTLFFLALSGCKSKSGDNTETMKSITKPVENITPTEDQKERRQRSEEICKSRNIPVYQNPNSLFVDSEEQVVLRTTDEIVDRMWALLYIGLKSEGMEQERLDKMDKEFNITSKLSAAEKAYAFAEHPTDQQRTDANWRYESLHVLLWALGYIETLDYPDKMCDVANDAKIIFELRGEKLRTNAKLRSKKEILDQADLILRLNWACVGARLKSEQAPGGLNPSIVYERHYSLNWLIRYLNQEWDDVRTDT
jgi:hypothetical protein